MPKKKYQKKKKVKKTALSKGISNENRMFRCKIAGVIPITFAASLDTQLERNTFCLNYPLFYRKDDGTRQLMSVDSGTAVSTIWPKLLGVDPLFDLYKVLSLKVTFMPNSLPVTNNSTTFDVGDAPNIIYGYRDRDDDNLIDYERRALDLGIAPQSWLTKSAISWTYNQPSYNKGWLNTQSFQDEPLSQDQAGYSGLPAGLKTLMVANMGINTGGPYYVGRMYAQWDVMFKSINIDTVA